MKIRRSLLLFCAAVALLTALPMWIGRSQRVETRLPVPTESNGAPSVAPNLRTRVRTTNQVQAAFAATTTTSPPAENKRLGKAEILSSANDVPIDFYGKLEDQLSNAVANAAVSFSVRVYNGLRSGQDHGQTTSDANGMFTISGYKGESLGLSVQKPGYVFVSMNGSGIYSKLWPEEQRAHPDPSNPIIIKMWKLQGAEPLVAIDKEYRLPFTGVPLFFDLLNGSVSDTGGDLKVVITRAPGSISQRNRGDWSIAVIPVNGGILEPRYNTSYITFSAPESGYQTNYFVEMKHDDPGWFDNVHKALFLKSRAGQVYAKFSLDFRINNEPEGKVYIAFRGVANTNGSRNWEATAPR